MDDWKPIESAPKDGALVLVTHPHIAMRPELLAWNKERAQWEGEAFAIAGSRRIWWDDSCFGPPSHWKPAGEPHQ